jgi:hypothetical protein
MRRSGYTLSLALIGCVLVGTLHAQDGNVFKEEDVRSLKSLEDKMSNVEKDLSREARKLPSQSKAQACLGMLSKQLSRVLDDMLPLNTLVFISSRMQLKWVSLSLTWLMIAVCHQAQGWTRSPHGALFFRASTIFGDRYSGKLATEVTEGDTHCS